jgi:replicative DNA helicase
MSAERNKNDSREQEVSFISSGVKALAKELDIPVIAISQLNRGSEKDKRRPRMSDLRESGSLEQDADLIAILWNPARDDEEDEDRSSIKVNLEICKQRNGPTGTVPLVFLREYTRFESVTHNAAPEPGYNSPYSDAQQEMPV